MNNNTRFPLLTIIAIILVFLVSLSAIAAYLYTQNQTLQSQVIQLRQELDSRRTPSPNATP